MKRILLLMFVSLMITSCSVGNNDENHPQTVETQENVSTSEAQDIYPKELTNEEAGQFIEKYIDFWTAFELPGVEEVSPSVFEYDWNPQTFNVFKSEEGSISVCYDITPSYAGNWYDVKSIVQEDENTYSLNVESHDIYFSTGENEIVYSNAWPNIDYFIIIDNNEEPKRIQIKTRFRENQDVFFYPGTEKTSNYDEWLKPQGFFINDINKPIESELYVDGTQVNLYEAKRIIEEHGLVFDTDIPENEWNNPKEYHFNYIIEGKEYYCSRCKLGTTVFFSYY